MNFSTLIGFLAAVSVFSGALITSAKNFSIFLDSHAILIVVGGTAAATQICFSLSKVIGLTRVFFKRILGRSKIDYLALIDQIVFLSQSNRKGRQAFEAAITKIRDPFLADAAKVLFWLDAEISPEDLRSLLETRAETHFERYIQEAEIFRVMSRFPPAFGLLGTTLGMIALLQALGKADSKNLIGPSMSIALVATLYGIVLSNFLFIPIAENLTQQSRDDLISRRIVVEGIMLIAADKPTQFVEEKVKSFLLPSERGNANARRRPPASGGKTPAGKEAA
jgi:chemotaxis protein MotA